MAATKRPGSVTAKPCRKTSWPAFWVGHPQHGQRLRYPSRLTLPWRLTSRISGPSSGMEGSYAGWLGDPELHRRRSDARERPLSAGAEKVVEPCPALDQRITCRRGAGIERWEPPRAERQLPPDAPRGGQERAHGQELHRGGQAVRRLLAERGHPLTVEAITRNDVSKGHARCHRSRPGSSRNHRAVSQSSHSVLFRSVCLSRYRSTLPGTRSHGCSRLLASKASAGLART
jgi:hypothetical protein